MFVRIDEVDAAVVWACGAVPGQARLRINRAVWLCRDEVKPAHVRVGDEDPTAKPGWTQAIGVDGDEELAAALATLGERTDLHDLPGGADGHIAIRAVV